MKLSEVLKFTSGILIGEADYEKEIDFFITDTRYDVKNAFFIPLIGENFDAHMFIEDAFEKGAIGTFTGRDMKPAEGKIIIKVEDTLKAFHDLARDYRKTINVPLIAVTGSVGKTTTKDMIASVLSEEYRVLKSVGNFNNFVGLPTTLLGYKNEEIIVQEMGMNHFGEIDVLTKIARPEMAVITNIGHSHIGILGSKENILKAKMEIVNGMDKNGIIIINNDDVLLQTIKGKVGQQIITYGIKNKSDFMAYDIKLADTSTAFKIKYKENIHQIQIPLVGEHFVYDALSAIVVGVLNKVKFESIIEGISNFKLSKMRMDITEKEGVKIINDTYNAGPESMRASLETLKKISGGRKIAVLADMLELGEFSKKIHFDLGTFIGNLDIDFLITVGDEAKEIAKGAIDAGMLSEKVVIAVDRGTVMEKLKNLLQKGDVLLVKGSRAMKMNEVVEKL